MTGVVYVLAVVVGGLELYDHPVAFATLAEATAASGDRGPWSTTGTPPGPVTYRPAEARYPGPVIWALTLGAYQPAAELQP